MTNQNFNDVSAQRPSVESKTTADDVPDGGLQAWRVVAGSWCCLFASFGWITCIGVFQNYYQSHQLSAYSSSTVAWIPATETFLMFAGAPVCGKIFDSYGPRPLIVSGTLLHVFGLMMVSISHEYYQFFLAQSVCSAIGSSALFWGGNTAVGTWFSRRRALALGIVSSGSSIGGLVGTAAIPNLFSSIGFGWTMRTIAFIYLALLAIAIVSVKSRIQHSPKRPVLSEFIAPLRQRDLLLTSAAGFWFFMGVFIPYNYLISESVYYGMSQQLANYTLTILSATSVFGRILPLWVGDHYGRFNAMITTSLVSAILVLALWIPANTNATNLAFAGLYGFSSGTFVAMVPALIAQVCGDVKKLGSYMGASYLVICPAIIIAQPIAGALVDADDGDFTWLQVYCGLCMIVGSVFFSLARGAHRTFRWAKI
ncbi:MAG: hypothetical protein M1821_009651 [Bathelium mastoideum]|nr:MAG: hypothetical protein M1821_009651 [Bathelium mastoideum]